jgi:DNA repair exonuclease SbcCD ATPase subunit
METTDFYRRKLNSHLADYDHARTQYAKEGKELKLEQRKLRAGEKARALVQEVAQQVQTKVHRQIDGVVTQALQSVFEPCYSFRLGFEKKRGRTEAELIIKKGDLEMDPLSSAGGGQIDVAAFALRVACLVLSRPKSRPLLILDEPFKNVSKAEGYLDRIPGLLQRTADELGIHIIMVTHINELKMGNIIEIEGGT